MNKDINMDNQNQLINAYHLKKEEYLRLATQYQYIFELTKCCGYSEWISVYKDQPLSQLYENIRFQFNGLVPKKLYAIRNDTGERLEIANENQTSFRNLIVNNSNFFRPIYPLPHHIIYKIYYDDGTCYQFDHSNPNSNSQTCELHR